MTSLIGVIHADNIFFLTIHAFLIWLLRESLHLESLLDVADSQLDRYCQFQCAWVSPAWVKEV
ncbi:uncharacterized protein BO66DRAFT_51230 [Aspergillus aculeatinus CBS 121060]|uniref:Uncharacterized protein n=1 Tax=Aspergillus aculeatinus CBS 121060 TaxID=1448322 RepID=A0ACD1HDM7_9EURO|nr:hypothetical protein BO66DRAFT_51230 [Aspergillus aculeatinus CBS 121060]RAH71513.1 hypothetical protein BO66DRAFT_51230 [Aspergillus aculeatinus CBS 121060]